MASAIAATVAKMIESLPEPVQQRVLEHLQEYIEDIRDEIQWDVSFARTQDNLVLAARRARAGVARGLAAPIEPDQL